MWSRVAEKEESANKELRKLDLLGGVSKGRRIQQTRFFVCFSFFFKLANTGSL